MVSGMVVPSGAISTISSSSSFGWVMFIQTVARPLVVLLITPTPVTLILKKVRVVLLPGIAPPVPVKVCACKTEEKTNANKKSKYDFINKFRPLAIM